MSSHPISPNWQSLEDFRAELGEVLQMGNMTYRQRLSTKKAKRKSAVLVPFAWAGEVKILLLRRSESAPAHPGQMAFPGGQIDREDHDAKDAEEQAALRECFEELNVPVDRHEAIGKLEPLFIPTSGFSVVPVVSLSPAGAFPFEPNLAEIQSAAWHPFSEFFDPNHHETKLHEVEGRSFPIHYYRNTEVPTWGATAAMIFELVERFRKHWTLSND